MLGQLQVDPSAPSPMDDELARHNQKPPVDESELYWAARKAQDVITELNKKEKAFYDFALAGGWTRMTRHMMAQYYGQDANTGEWITQITNFDGFQDELVRFRINETRSYVKQLITMGIGTRPSFECSATNSDYDSIGQAETGDAIIEYVYDACYGERKERATVTKGEIGGRSWSWCNWDVQGGQDVPTPVLDPATGMPPMRQLPDGSQAPVLDPKTGKPPMKTEKSGELVLKSLGWWDVFSEVNVEEHDGHLWLVARERRSKWEIAGRFKDKRKQILALPNGDDYVLERLLRFRAVTAVQTDEIIVKHFYHVPSMAMSDEFQRGRYIMYAGDISLIDTTLPYKVIPLVDYCPAVFVGTSFGYADSWDLCSLNQMLDQIVSDVASNLSTFGRQCISVEEGTDFSADDLANGMRVLTRRPNTKPPEALMLAAVPAAAQWFLDFIEKKFQSVSALNSVTRGNPDASITSGTMAALFHSIAIECNSGMQQAVDNHRERLANLILDILKQYAYHPMVARIAGADERPYLDTFTRDKLLGIRGVTVKTSNPMMRTQAGRLQYAEMVMKIPGAVSDPAQINEIFVSGQAKLLYDAPRKRRMRIKLEDEMLLEGPPTQMAQDPPMGPPLPNGVQPPQKPPYPTVPTVPVHALDDHPRHIDQHYALLASREALKNKAIWDAVNAHIQNHIKVWKETDPALLGSQHIQPYPQQAAPPMGAPPPQQLPPGAHPAQGAAPPPDQHQDPTSLGVKLPEPAKSPVAGNVPQGPK